MSEASIQYNIPFVYSGYQNSVLYEWKKTSKTFSIWLFLTKLREYIKQDSITIDTTLPLKKSHWNRANL